MAASTVATSQYAQTDSKLAARIILLSHDTSPQRWHTWLGDRLAVRGAVLEVGAGTGELWKHVDHSQAKLTLTDFSAAMCDTLRGLGIEGAEVRQCDATELPFGDEVFDTVIANHMLYHVDSPGEAIAEFARVLKPGGRVFTALNGRDHIEELLNLGTAIGRPSQILNHAKITAESAPEYLEKSFVEVKSERFPGCFEIKEARPVLAYLGSWGDDDLTAEQDERARGEVDGVIAREGSYKIKKHMVLLSGTKA